MENTECELIAGAISYGFRCFPFSGLLNHSCNPNTCKGFSKDGSIIFCATQPIKKGCQVRTKFRF